MADLGDESLKERIAELRAIKSQAQTDAERATVAAEGIGFDITPANLAAFAATARRKLRGPDGGFRRDHLRALAQRVDVADHEVRIMGQRSELLRQLAIANGVGTVAGGVPSFVPKWRSGSPPASYGKLLIIHVYLFEIGFNPTLCPTSEDYRHTGRC